MITPVKNILFSAIFFCLISCGPQQRSGSGITQTGDIYEPTYTADQLYHKLEFGFKNEKPDSFRQIFIDWNRIIKPNSDEFIHQNDTINAVFDVYKEFYKPLDLLKLGDWEWGNELNSKSEYVAVQNKIFYSVFNGDNPDDLDPGNPKRDSISNFRPPINLDQDKVLYLTDEYASAIIRFLGTESTELGERSIMDPSRPKGDSEKRYEALRSYIPVLHGHWGGYWHLETHPNVSTIVFNNTLTKAKVTFRVGYQGGEATLEKKDRDWTIKESKATWIE